MTAEPVLTSLTLNGDHPEVRAETADLCRMHGWIIDATVGMPDHDARVLWAQPQRYALVIRAPEPITAARLPRGYASVIASRPWHVPDRAGVWRMVAVVTRPGTAPPADPPRPNRTGSG